MQWASLPDPSTMLAAVTAWANPFFTSYLSIAYFAIGISVGIMIILFVVLLFRGVLNRGVGGAMIPSSLFSKTSGSLRSGLAKMDSWTFRHSKQGRAWIADMNK